MERQEIIEAIEARLVALKDEEKGLREALTALKQKRRRPPTTTTRFAVSVRPEKVEKAVRELEGHGQPATAEEWAELTGLSTTTVRRVAKADSRVVYRQVNRGIGNGRGGSHRVYELASAARERAAAEDGD